MSSRHFAGSPQLRDRVSFYEQLANQSTSQNASSSEDLVDGDTSGINDNIAVRSSKESLKRRNSDSSSHEESYERLVEEGHYAGTRIVKFEKIVLKKSIREVTSSSITGATSQDATSPQIHHPNEASRTPSDVEHNLEDSAYQSHHGVHGSKSSSTTSFPRFASEDSLTRIGRSSSPRFLSPSDDRSTGEWYTEYRNQSFNSPVGRPDYLHSKSQFDAHIAEIKGIVIICFGIHVILIAGKLRFKWREWNAWLILGYISVDVVSLIWRVV
ncbi:hypothetical protein QAD02_004808 [Eretmocerus hayati]|uniref:Uncharacterized protein n=1 Tax=Eretmocerus hayati TaxID=131215 RepID=A0ACC2NRN3_9HYME|nr:hypothetical protein QAD02_004808 [Eretmocerus hayati]